MRFNSIYTILRADPQIKQNKNKECLLIIEL